MNIAYVTVSMPFGSGETFFIPEVHELRRLGHTVTIIPRSPRGIVTNEDALGLEECSIRQPLFSFEVLRYAVIEFLRQPIQVLGTLILLMRHGRPRASLNNLAVFPKALWFARVVRKNHIDHIHCQWALTTATIAMVASKITHRPWSVTAHRGDIAYNNLLAMKVRNAAFVRFISHDGVRMARTLGADDAEAKGVVIRVGVDIPEAPVSINPTDKPIILCPANLLPVKGHKYLIEAMGMLKHNGVNVQLEIAGSGPLESELRDLVESSELSDQIRLVGQIPHQALLDRYGRGEISMVVLPSVHLGDNTHEGVPVCLIEAMAYGVPVISTKTGGIPELLADGAGLLVPDKDASALADAIQKVLSDQTACDAMIAKGRQVVESEYDVRVTTKALLDLIEERQPYI